MQFIPSDVPEVLEFDKLMQYASKYCFSSESRLNISRLKPSINFNSIKYEFELISELRDAWLESESLPLSSYNEIKEILKHLLVENYVLDDDEILTLRAIIEIRNRISIFLKSLEADKMPKVIDLVSKFPFEKSPLNLINKFYNEKGEFKENGSPQLIIISKKIKAKNAEITSRFNKILSSLKDKGLLADSLESYKNGRRVLAVPVEKKRSIDGVIHDTSGSGRTAFIEPQIIVNLNNDLWELYSERNNEIYRIKQTLCNDLRPFSDDFRYSKEIIYKLDILNAKMMMGFALEGVIPNISDKPVLKIISGMHPLLLLKNKRDKKPVVPLNLELFGNNKMVVISGPNAGGKSIALKTVGLLQMLFQTSIPIPVHSESVFGLFKSIYTDIGDRQSVEDDLSTYSSRLKTLKMIIDKANPNSLILIDEFGSGTDPNVGGAIAEAILDELVVSKSFGVITTHYSNLKIYTHKKKGIVNAAMMFNKETLKPTFMLKVGRPGNSYAFEIAKKIGLSNKVMTYARKKVGDKTQKVEDLLADLQYKQGVIEEKEAALREKENYIDSLISKYEDLFKDLEVRRKRIKYDKKQIEQGDINIKSLELKKLIAELKSSRDLEKAKKVSLKMKSTREDVHKELKELEEIIYSDAIKNNEEPIFVGDNVKMIKGGASGIVESINGKKAIVEIGFMRMTIPLIELTKVKPVTSKINKGVKVKLSSSSSLVSSKLDIRGKSRAEALIVLRSFFDNSMLSDNNYLEIIHGKGNGVLRQLVKEIAREYDDISNIYSPKEESGGTGKTIIEF